MPESADAPAASCAVCGETHARGEPCPACSSKAGLRTEVTPSTARTEIGSGRVPVDSEMKTALGTPPLAGARAYADVQALAAGTLIGARYEVLTQLGQGGMGAVYRSRDRVLDEEVALKVLLPGIVGAPGMAERFLLEAKTSLRLTHPGIVRVRSFEVDREHGLSYIVMALVRGRSLRSLLVEKKRLDWREAVDLVRQVLEALAVAHEITVHRDLKPENVMVDAAGRAVVLDFGLAKSALAGGSSGGAQLTQAGAVMGTYAYMAPEQRLDSSSVDARADVFAMGAILYECWTGMIPAGSFPAPRVIRPELPEGADEVIQRSLALLADHRYPSARAMLDALEKLAAKPPASPPVAPPPPAAPAPLPAPAPSPRSRAPVAIAIAVVVAGLGLAFALASKHGQDPAGAGHAGVVAGGTTPSSGAAPRLPEQTPAPAAPSAAAAPTGPLPERIALDGPPPADPPLTGSPIEPERFGAVAEPAWKRFLAEKKPFKAFPTQALLEGWPALKGSLVYVERLWQDVDFTDRKGVQHTVRDTEDGMLVARWSAEMLDKEAWFAYEVYRFDGNVNQDVVGVLVDRVKRERTFNGQVEVVECPVIEVHWKWVHGIATYLPSPDGAHVVVAGEPEWRAAAARGFTDPKLGPDAKPEAVVLAAITAAKEANRALYDRLSAPGQTPRDLTHRWRDVRQQFIRWGSGPPSPDSTIASWEARPARLFKNFRGEDEAEVEVAYTSVKGVAAYKTDAFELAREAGGWRLADLDRFRPMPRSNAAPPGAGAPPEAVYAAFIRAAMEDDRELAKRLVTADQQSVAVPWLETWQGMLRGGMVEAPAAKIEMDGDIAKIQTAPRNKREEKTMYARTVELKREGGVWRISQGQ